MADVKKETKFYKPPSLSCGLTFASSPDLCEERGMEGQSRNVKLALLLDSPAIRKDSISPSLGRQEPLEMESLGMESWDSVKEEFLGAGEKPHCQYLFRGKSCVQ